jgi:hypothetical protein
MHTIRDPYSNLQHLMFGGHTQIAEQHTTIQSHVSRTLLLSLAAQRQYWVDYTEKMDTISFICEVSYIPTSSRFV